MSLPPPTTEYPAERVRKILLVILALGISLLFLWMIRDFLVALLFAALAAGMSYPYYRKLSIRLKGRNPLAASITLGVLLLLVIIPVTAFGALVAVQAAEIGEAAGPWVKDQIHQASGEDFLTRFPELSRLSPYRDQILAKVGELSASLGSMAVTLVTEAARQTATFFLLLFVMLYATFFFLLTGRATLRKILYYLPLPPEDEDRIVGRFVSVARATLKGTFVIGFAQGALGGLGFWVADIQGAALWATMMGVLAIVPGLGPVMVWLPAVIYLFVMQRFGAAFGLGAWCIGVVGTVDNFLRPWLVGKDTKMPDLLILLATLGGIVMFGALGFVIGPIIAALFVTIWDIYGDVFRNVLPEPPPLSTIPPVPSQALAESIRSFQSRVTGAPAASGAAPLGKRESAARVDQSEAQRDEKDADEPPTSGPGSSGA
ncbi:MAG TPA: AI-2E family transporter [Polyangiaceae bacterium]|nr:AI-2E family transporter [Polyangiaceae bacterium]